MKAIGSDNIVGQTLQDQHIQIYGWINPGGNVSTAKTGYNGNAPVGYAFNPNIAQLDQAVIYVERIPDGADGPYRLGLSHKRDVWIGHPLHRLLRRLQQPVVIRQPFFRLRHAMVYGEMYVPRAGDVPTAHSRLPWKEPARMGTRAPPECRGTQSSDRRQHFCRRPCDSTIRHRGLGKAPPCRRSGWLAPGRG